MKEQKDVKANGLIETFSQNVLKNAMNRDENGYNSADIRIDDFKKFCGVFVPFYLKVCLKKESAVAFSKLSEFRHVLKELYPNESNMLTEPFLAFVRPYLDELNIYLLYDRIHTPRTDRIAFTRTSCLREEEKIIRLEHYLLDENICIPKVFCSDCVGQYAGGYSCKCTKKPVPEPAHLCDLFEPKVNLQK